jgi:hypothetical protein
MLPNWLRLIIVSLLILLVINLFLNLSRKLKGERVPQVALLVANRTYSCEVDRAEDCRLFCYEMNSATLLCLKPERCDSLKGLKRGEIVTFEVENLPYYGDGCAPVKIIHP